MIVTIPDGHPDLNLAAWLDWRREQIGPWSDYIIREVGKMEHEIANLRSAASGWQPIETAPRDGTAILASGLDHGKGPSRHYSVVEWMDFGCESGWYPDEDADPHIYLTHWMPLPKPPTKDSTHD